MSKPLVSIIIPVYNYEGYVRDCLLSCIRQNYWNVEVIAVDDASTDQSPHVLRLYRQLDPRVRILEMSRNQGYSHAKNEAILAAKGEYIVHIDADDMLSPESIEVRLDKLLRHPEADLVHGRALKFYGDKDWNWCVEHSNELKIDPRPVHAQGVMLRRRVFEKHGLYFEQLRSKADKEMWFRLGIHPKSPLKLRVKVETTQRIVAFYRSHERSMHHARKKDPAIDAPILAMFDQRMKELKKHGITRENTRFPE